MPRGVPNSPKGPAIPAPEPFVVISADAEGFRLSAYGLDTGGGDSCPSPGPDSHGR